jgi:broad specificity phosphatase PhoE
MTAVYVLRHPQSTWNVANRYQGRLESPLTELGCQQATLTAAAFRDESIDAVYASPLIRARLLAEALARTTGAGYTVDNRLTEIAMGPWEGLDRDEIRNLFPQMFREWYSRPDRVRFPQGESMDDVCRRSRSALEDIFRRHREGNVCVVTHSAVVHALVLPALGLGLRFLHRVATANAGITTLCGTEAPGRVQILNSVSHLYGSAVESATALGCVTVKPRRRAS